MNFKIILEESWDNALNNTINKKNDVISSIKKTEERSQHLLFTTPYIISPSVVVTDNAHCHLATLDMLKGKKVAAVCCCR